MRGKGILGKSGAIFTGMRSVEPILEATKDVPETFAHY